MLIIQPIVNRAAYHLLTAVHWSLDMAAVVVMEMSSHVELVGSSSSPHLPPCMTDDFDLDDPSLQLEVELSRDTSQAPSHVTSTRDLHADKNKHDTTDTELDEFVRDLDATTWDMKEAEAEPAHEMQEEKTNDEYEQHIISTTISQEKKTKEHHVISTTIPQEEEQTHDQDNDGKSESTFIKINTNTNPTTETSQDDNQLDDSEESNFFMTQGKQEPEQLQQTTTSTPVTPTPAPTTTSTSTSTSTAVVPKSKSPSPPRTKKPAQPQTARSNSATSKPVTSSTSLTPRVQTSPTTTTTSSSSQQERFQQRLQSWITHRRKYHDQIMAEHAKEQEERDKENERQRKANQTLLKAQQKQAQHEHELRHLELKQQRTWIWKQRVREQHQREHHLITCETMWREGKQRMAQTQRERYHHHYDLKKKDAIRVSPLSAVPCFVNISYVTYHMIGKTP